MSRRGKIGDYSRSKLEKIIQDVAPAGGGGGGGGSGDVTGPGSSTTTAIVRFNGTTGKIIQNSGCTIDGSNNMTVAGDLTISGNNIKDGGDSAGITFDGSGNTAVDGDLTVTGGDVTVGAAGNTTATTIGVVTNTGTNVGKALTIAAGSSTTGANNINGGDLTLAAGGGDGTGTSKMLFKTKVNGTDAAAERMRIHTTGEVGIGGTPDTTLHVFAADARIRAEATAGNHPGFELSEDGSRKWIIYNDPDDNDNLVFKSTHDRMELSTGGNLQIDGDLTIGGDDLFMATNTNRYILVADATNYNPEPADAIGADTGIIIAGQMFSH